MYIERLSIKNFRCFAETELELNYPGRKATKDRPVPKRYPNVNLLLGHNGTGKTSVFRAAIIGVLGPVLAASSTGFQSDHLIRRLRRTLVQTTTVEVPNSAEVHSVLRLHPIDAVPQYGDRIKLVSKVRRKKRR